jgi:dienelactone hydrolase
MRAGIAAGLIAGFLLAAAPAAAQEPAGAADSAATRLVRQMAGGDFSGVETHFDSVMKARLGADALGTLWQQLIGQVGAYRGITASSVQHRGGYEVATVTTRFARAVLDVVIAYNAAGEVSGLHFVPSASALPVASYDDSSGYSEREVTVGPLALPGTLAMPRGSGPFPAVVLVHGSGPGDRNETVGGVSPFKDLAHGLASSGVAVLRYDKRTRVHPETFTGTFTVDQETVIDAQAAADLLHRTPGVDSRRVVVLGHSLGGMLAPRIAQGDSAVEGLIIMAGATRPLPALMLEQTAYLDSLSAPNDTATRQQLEQVRQAARQAEALTEADSASTKPVLGAPPSYWLDLRRYHPAAVAAQLHTPMLILQGGRDYQVTAADYEGWRKTLEGKPNVTFRLFPDLNHLFVTGTGRSTPGEYANPAHVAPEVITEIAAWVKALPGRAVPHP